MWCTCRLRSTHVRTCLSGHKLCPSPEQDNACSPCRYIYRSHHEGQSLCVSQESGGELAGKPHGSQTVCSFPADIPGCQKTVSGRPASGRAGRQHNLPQSERNQPGCLLIKAVHHQRLLRRTVRMALSIHMWQSCEATDQRWCIVSCML